MVIQDEHLAKSWQEIEDNTDKDSKFETDLLGFNLVNDDIKNLPDNEILGKYRNLYDVEDDKVLTHKIWIKRLKINLLIRNFPQTVHKINTLTNKLATKCKLDMHDMAAELLITGLFQKIKELSQLKVEIDDEFYREYCAMLELEEIAKERNMVDTLTPIFERRTREEFEAWCKRSGWSYEKFYELRNAEMRKLSFSKRSKMWIHENVKLLNEPMPVDEFIGKAMKQGILDESQYSAFYQHISRLGYLGRPHGYVFDED